MKILFAYLGRDKAAHADFLDIAACAPATMRIKPFRLALPSRSGKLTWAELDRHWRAREPRLMRLHERLHEAAADCDVLLHYHGYNIHPEVLNHLPTFNVYSSMVDPESSDRYSAPAAPAYDAVFYGNIASGPQYGAWGCRRRAHLPIFVPPRKLPAGRQAEALVRRKRDQDIILCCGFSRWRRQRLLRLKEAFPQAGCFGAGWDAGRLSEAELLDAYARSRIGWNIHNSTGPINQRLFMLAAWGVMPLCDNRTGLGHLFKLDREAVGFDTIPEAIELTRYYLEHEDVRAAVARRAGERFRRDFAPAVLWERIRRQLQR